MTDSRNNLWTTADSFNITVVVGPHALGYILKKYLDSLHIPLHQFNQEIKDKLTVLFKRLININSGHCRDLDTVAGEWDENRWEQWVWNDDLKEHAKFFIPTHLPNRELKVMLDMVNPCTLQQSDRNGMLIYRVPFTAEYSETDSYDGRIGNRCRKLCIQVIITPKHSLQTLSLVNLLKLMKTKEELLEFKTTWCSTSLSTLVNSMSRLVEFSLPARTDKNWKMLVLAGGKMPMPLRGRQSSVYDAYTCEDDNFYVSKFLNF